MYHKKLSPSEAAEYIGFSEGTLANWRSQKRGPPYYGPEGKIFYLAHDLDKWLEDSRKEPEQK